jgi:hypothetical protein
MKAIRVLALGTIFTLGCTLGLQAQATTATDSEDSVQQSEAKPAPAMDQQTTAPEENNQPTAPASNDQQATPAAEDGCGAACP